MRRTVSMNQVLVVQDELLGLEDAEVILALALLELLLGALQLAVGDLDGVAQPGHLGGDLLGLDVAVHDAQRAQVGDVGAPDGDARRRAGAA